MLLPNKYLLENCTPLGGLMLPQCAHRKLTCACT